MIETYYKYKSSYNNYILLIKSGNFYEIFDKDALILNDLFGYKVKKYKNSLKVGFPISKLNDILDKLSDYNYLVIDKEVQEKNETDNNKYSEKEFDVSRILFNFMRLERINERLTDLICTPKIDDVLNKVEEML